MSFSSFYAGLTGLKTYSSSLGVIGNNLANINTIGYKSGRAQFAELVSQAFGTAANGAGNVLQAGLGVRLAGVQSQFSQGALQATGLVTDMAIQGNGFFVMRDANGAQMYSRAGSFTFDKDGFLVNPAGHRVQAYTQRDALGRIQSSGDLGDVLIPLGMQSDPQATATMRLQLNLDAQTDLAAPPFATSIAVYDSLGAEHDLTMRFTPQDTDSDGTIDQWLWEAMLPASELAGGGTGDTVVGSGTLQFDGSGQLVSPTTDQSISIPAWSNGADAQTVTWQLFDPESGDPVLSSFAKSSVLSDYTQDGFPPGELQGLSVDAAGLITGTFSNGRTEELAQIAIANFNNPGGLLKAGDNEFVATVGSGPAVIGEAGLGGRGSIAAQALELSNVDITEQFTDLIIAQRGYQSNSRVITTTDEVIQEALSLKR